MALRPIARPIDRIAVSILGNVTLAKIQHLQDSITTKSRRNIRNLIGRTDAPGGHNLVNLDIASLDTASRRGTRDIQVRLDVGFSTGSIDKAKAANPLSINQMEQIDSLLGALRRIEVVGDVECEAVFVFHQNETDPIISLPNPVSLGLESNGTEVRGVRVAGFEDDSMSVMIDGQRDGTLRVGVSFTTQVLVGQQVTNRVAALAIPTVEMLVRPQINIQLET
ncbi:uncharacterized protein METZ01_LOCUS102302 [marine metagenome]|uniref:Uncharacterized protein n=1 Tax=marine metagenome TaxID=408172 RepID=A0A381WBP7_9ZZZZ